MLTLKNKAVRRLTENEFNQCWMKNMGDGGQMRDLLDDCISWRRGGRAIMLWDEDELVAWCLTYPKAKTKAAMFYTVPNYRNKGYGTLLMNEVYKTVPKPFIFPHDKRSASFFKHFKSIVCDDLDKGWLDEK